VLKCAGVFKKTRPLRTGASLTAVFALVFSFVLAGCKAVGVSFGGDDKKLMVKTFMLYSPDLNENAVSAAPNEKGQIDIVIPFHWDITQLSGAFILEADVTIAPDPQDDPDYQAERKFVAANPEGEREEYRVIVKRYSPSDKEIRSFRFSGVNHEDALIELINESEATVTVNVPYDTDTSSLAAEVEIAAASITPPPTETYDYAAASPVEFIVHAGNGSTRKYTVTVNKLSNTENKILTFKIGDTQGVIDYDVNPKTIHITLPYGTSLGPHTPDITVSAGADWEPKTQQSFGSTVDYTVTAADNVTQSVYRVIPNVALSNENKITSFAASTADTALAQVLALMPASTINHTQGTIVVTIPKNMSKTFAPVITHQGVSVNPASGTSRNFTSAQTYVVKAANNDEKTYSVTAANHAGIAASLLDVQANSSTPGTATTLFTLTFDKAVPTLTAANISLTTESGQSITKNALTATGNPNVWNLAVSNASKNELAVTVGKASDPVGYTLTANKTVHAFCSSYDIYYVPNGGSGQAQTFLAAPGTSHTIRPGNLFTAPAGSSEFVTWGNSADGSGSIYPPNTAITVTGNTFLFAVWRNVPDEPASGQEHAADLMVKFGIKAPGYAYSSITPVNVLMTFMAIHKYIATVNPASAASKIAAGNYIDLRSLTVAKSAINAGDFTKTPASGGDLRLLVVGRNTFNGKHGNAGNLNHVVFRFAKSPGSHPYESALPRKTYLNSALRAYLLNQYITGLQNAGVPLHDDSVVYTPIRRTGKANVVTTEYEQYTDKLWLPTAKEMGNSTQWGNNFEKSAEAAAGGGLVTFEYYQSTPIPGSASEDFWTSTPGGGITANDTTWSQTCYVLYVKSYNTFDVLSVENTRPVAPAFSIK
jgi:hypothetical protein